MRALEFVVEARVPSVREQIIADVQKHGAGEYFVRFTDRDKLGFSGRQWFGQTPDVDHPKFDVDYIGHGVGRRPYGSIPWQHTWMKLAEFTPKNNPMFG